jgi:hypothetical protein
MSTALSDKIVPLLQHVCENVETLRTDLINDGFTIDTYVFENLKKLEPSNSNLLPARQYFSELIKEKLLSLQCSKFRRSAQNGYHSDYLHWLDDARQNNTWDHEYTCSMYTQPSMMYLVSLFSNFSKEEHDCNIFKHFYEGLNSTIYADIEKLQLEHSELFHKEVDFNKKGLRRIVDYLLDGLEFEEVKKLKGGAGYLTYSMQLPNSSGVFYFCIDVRNWMNVHKWDIAFAITSEQIKEVFSYGGYSPYPIMFDLEVFCPSALWINKFTNYSFGYDKSKSEGVFTVQGVDYSRNIYAGLFLRSFLKSFIRLLANPK